MDKIKASAEAEAIAKKLEHEKRLQEALETNCRQLYKLRCFEIMNQENGVPIAMRVPGGWIFYIMSGGGSLHLATGEDDEQQQIAGRVAPTIVPTFVPFSAEFINGPDAVKLS